jgi:hypothetical protein
VRGERIHNARRAALMRLVIVGAFLSNSLAMVFVVRAWPYRAATTVLVVYVLLAALLLLLVHRSERAALLSWFAIPFLDIPLTFAIQVADISTTRYEGDQGPLLLFLISLQLLLILFSTLSLRVPVVALSAGMSIVLSVLFARWASIPGWSVRGTILIAAFTAAALRAWEVGGAPDEEREGTGPARPPETLLQPADRGGAGARRGKGRGVGDPHDHGPVRRHPGLHDDHA